MISTVGLWGGVLLVLALLGAQGGAWIIAALAGLTLVEFYRLLDRAGVPSDLRLGTGLGVGLVLAAYYLPTTFGLAYTGGEGLAVAVLACAAAALAQPPENRRPELLAGTLAGLVYVAFMLQFLVLVITLADEPSQGLALGFWVVAVAKFNDVGALLTGRTWGRHKMCPTVSPGKTWEGAAGGVAVAAAVGLGLVAAFPGLFPGSFDAFIAPVVAVPVAVSGIVSDLIESLLKRRAGVKDSGDMIPGIGGAFDLSDSLILPAPVAFFLLALVV